MLKIRLPMASVLLVLCGLVLLVTGISQQKQASYPDVVRDILWWFPEDTETITVAQREFKAEEINLDPPRDLSHAFSMVSIRVFLALQDGKFYNQLHGQKVLLSVEASRRFRPPTTLGGMLYEGCTAIFFERGFTRIRESLSKSLQANANEIMEVGGYKVWRFDEKRDEDQWKIYVTLPKEGLLLVATDQSFLTETLARMNTRSVKRAFPPDLPEWKYANLQAPFWGIRHYARKDFSDDPSSPLAGEDKDYNIPDKQAIGFVYSFDPDRAPELRIKYLTTSKSPAVPMLTKHYWSQSSAEHKLTFQSSESGMDISFVLDNSWPDYMIPFLLMAALGHGAYV